MIIEGVTVGGGLRGRPSAEAQCGTLGWPQRATPTVRPRDFEVNNEKVGGFVVSDRDRATV
jgi:hypothetical protein